MAIYKSKMINRSTNVAFSVEVSWGYVYITRRAQTSSQMSYTYITRRAQTSKSIKDSTSLTEEYIYKWVEDFDDVGKHQKMQVIIDNHVLNMYIKKMMIVIRPSLFWNNYVACTIDLTMKDILRLPRYKSVIEKTIYHCISLFTS